VVPVAKRQRSRRPGSPERKTDASVAVASAATARRAGDVELLRDREDIVEQEEDAAVCLRILGDVGAAHGDGEPKKNSGEFSVEEEKRREGGGGERKEEALGFPWESRVG
jgi:hypothetical protein